LPPAAAPPRSGHLANMAAYCHPTQGPAPQIARWQPRACAVPLTPDSPPRMGVRPRLPGSAAPRHAAGPGRPAPQQKRRRRRRNGGTAQRTPSCRPCRPWRQMPSRERPPRPAAARGGDRLDAPVRPPPPRVLPESGLGPAFSGNRRRNAGIFGPAAAASAFSLTANLDGGINTNLGSATTTRLRTLQGRAGA